jgi:hypothetical protein
MASAFRISRFVACAALLLPLLSLAGATADDGWVPASKARSPEDLSLWTRYVDGAQLKAFRGMSHTRAPLHAIVTFLNDVERSPDWIFRCREARLLQRDYGGDTYIYMRYKGIWPMEDRDAVIRLTSRYNPLTGEVLLNAEAAPDYLAPVEGVVRVPSIHSQWRLQPADDGLIRMTFTGHVDPGGFLPLWLANTLVTLIPRYTIRDAQEILDGPDYRSEDKLAHGRAILAEFAPLN